MNIQLIKATTSDAEAIQKMQIESFTPHFQRYKDVETSPVKESLEKMVYRINYEKGSYFKIIADNIHAGCVWIYENAPNLYRIGIMYISPEFQCKGVGHKALTIAETNPFTLLSFLQNMFVSHDTHHKEQMEVYLSGRG